MHDTLIHRQSLKNLYKLMNYHHHIHCLSLIQVAPGHVNEILATNMEGIKSENPELENVNIIKFVSNGLKLIDLKYSYFILNFQHYFIN